MRLSRATRQATSSRSPGTRPTAIVRDTLEGFGYRRLGKPMHQDDHDGVKGLDLINLVDEITQYECVGWSLRAS